MNPPDNGIIHPNFQTHVFTSRTVYEYDKAANRWVETFSETSVADKYNEWADINDMNPVFAPTTTTTVVRESETRLAWIKTMTAVSVGREDQMKLELFYRNQMARVIASLVSGAPAQEPPSRTLPARKSQAPPIVDVSGIGETAPAYPGAPQRVSYPAFDEASPS